MLLYTVFQFSLRNRESASVEIGAANQVVAAGVVIFEAQNRRQRQRQRGSQDLRGRVKKCRTNPIFAQRFFCTASTS